MRVGSLEIEILAGIARLQKDMNDAQRVVGGAMGNIEKSVASAKNAMQMIGVGLPLAAITDQVRRMTDQYTKLDAQLRLSTKSQAQYAQGMSDIRRISSIAQTDISATSMLYTRLMNVMQGTGVEQSKLATVTETVSFGLKAYGATAQEASSAALQLSQAMGANRLGGEEFRAVMEAMPNVMRVVADSMRVPLGELRQLSIDGKITGDVLVKALGNPAIAAQFKAMAENTQTVTGAWIVARNELMLLVGEFGKSSGGVNVFIGAFKALGETFVLLAKHMQSLMFIAGGYVTFLVTKLVVGTVLAIEKSIAHTEELAMNAAANLRAAQAEASLVAAKAATASATAASTVSLLRNTLVTVEANTATLAKTVADNAATIAQLNHARSVAQLSGHYYIIRQVEAELVVTTQALAAAQTELNFSTARQARLQAALIAEDKAALKARSALVEANAAVVVSQNAATASAIGNIAAIGVALRAATMAHPITAAALAISAIIVVIANWKDIIDGGKASFTWFMDEFIGGIQFLAKGVGISLGELVQKMSLLANLTWPDLKSGEFKKQWDKLGELAEQSRIEAAAKLRGIDKETRGREKLELAVRQMQERDAWDKLHATKQQQRTAEVAELDAQYVKLAGLQGRSQAEQIQLAEEYRVKMALIDEKYNREAVKAAGNAHTTKMQQALAALEAEVVAEEGKLSRVQKVSLEWQALKKKEQTLSEYALFARQVEIAATLDEIDRQAGLNKQLESGRAAYAEYWASVATSTEKLIEQAKQQEFENTLIGKTKDEIALLTAQRENDTLAKMEAIRVTMTDTSTAKEIADYEALIAAKKRVRDADVNKAAQEAQSAARAEQTKAYEDMWKKIDGFAHDAFDNIFDKGKNAFEEIGKVIKKSILDMLYKMTIQRWLIPISVTGGVSTSGMAGATDMFGGGSGGGGGGLGGLLNSAKSVWDVGSGAVSSMFAPAATGMAAMAGSTAVMTTEAFAAANAITGTAVAATEAATALSSVGSMATTAMPYVAAAMAVVALFDSFSSSSTSITGSGLNIAGKVGAPKTSGYTTGVTESSSWWGLDSSSSSWRTSSTASKETSLAITNMFAQIRSAIVLSGSAIGKDATALDNQIANFTISIGDLNLAGMDAAKQQEAITKAVSGMADSMVAQLVPGMEKFQQVNETLLQTLVRVATEVMTLNGFYLSLGVTTRATTASADKLAVALGGVAQAGQLMTSFIAGFAPEAQKTALALGTLKSAGLPMGEFLTTTQAWWDFAKIASAEQLTAILKNQDVIKAWVTSMEAASKAMQDKAVADYKAAVDATNSLRAFALSVRELQQSLWAGSQTPLSSTYDVTRSQFAATNMRAGAGDTNAQGNLASAATTFLDVAKKQAVSAIEYARDFAFVQNSLDATATLTENAVSVADQQLEQLRLANSWLAVIATVNQQQSVPSLVGTATSSVGAVNAAMSSQSSSAAKSIADENAFAAARAASIPATIPFSETNPNPAHVAAKQAAFDALNAAKLVATPYSSGYELYSSSLYERSVATKEQAALAKYGANIAKLQQTYDALPAFAVGTNEVPFDMTARIHKGEEIKPRAYVEQDKAVREETNTLLREMKKELTLIKNSNYRIQLVEEKWDDAGMPEVRVA